MLAFGYKYTSKKELHKKFLEVYLIFLLPVEPQKGAGTREIGDVEGEK